MGLFSRKKDKDKEKKVDEKSVKVSSEEKINKDKQEKIEPNQVKKPAAAKAPKTDKKKTMKDLYADTKIDTKKVVGSGKKEKRSYGNAYKVLVRPHVTEKAANLGAENKYVFVVSSDANKIEIAKAVKEVYGVKPVSVNIVRAKGKKVRHGRITGRRKDWKKAIIMLPAGKSINIYEGV